MQLQMPCSKKGTNNMQCPKCNEDMEFEEAKNFYGIWFCDCGFESNGSQLPASFDNGMVDYEERLD